LWLRLQAKYDEWEQMSKAKGRDRTTNQDAMRHPPH